MPQDTLLEAYLPEDIAHPPEAYFEAMRRLRLEPPDEETVERIMEIFREYWRRQDSEAAGELEGEGPGAVPPAVVPRGSSNQVQDISGALAPCGSQSFPHALGSANT